MADYLSSERKGINSTIKAFTNQNPDNSLLLIGGRTPNTISHNKIRYLGYINNKDELSNLFSVADVYINPTLADNLPNTVLESLSCGTPVTGFDTGGMSDMIDDSNGILLEPNYFEEIFNPKILGKLKCKNKIEMATNCHIKFDFKKQRDKYVELYAQILGNSK